MAVNSINYATMYSSDIFDPIILLPPKENPNCFQKFLHSKYFKYIKKILFAVFILNVMVWGNMLLFISVGAANKTIPDEHTRKIWIEICFQIVNGLLFIMIVGYTPQRIRDVYQFYSAKRQSTLQRHKYTNNLILLQFILWSLIANSIFQVAVAICMWSMDMYKRPMWLVSIFGGLGLVSGVFAGLAQFILKRIAKNKAKTEQQFNGIV